MTKHLNVFMKLYLIYVRKRNAVIPLNTDNNIRIARWFYLRIEVLPKKLNEKIGSFFAEFIFQMNV